MLSERVSEMQMQRHTDRAVRLASVFFFFLRHDTAKCRDDSSCTLLHQQPRAARNRRQTPESGDSLFALQLLRHKHFFLFECFMKRVAHVIWKRQECMYLSGRTTFLFNLSDGGIAEWAHGPEAHKEAERSASLRPAGIKAAEIATRWCVCTYRTKHFGSAYFAGGIEVLSLWCCSVLVKCWCFEELQNDNSFPLTGWSVLFITSVSLEDLCWWWKLDLWDEPTVFI